MYVVCELWRYEQPALCVVHRQQDPETGAYVDEEEEGYCRPDNCHNVDDCDLVMLGAFNQDLFQYLYLLVDPDYLQEFEYFEEVKGFVMVQSDQRRKTGYEIEDQESQKVSLGDFDHVVFVPREVSVFLHFLLLLSILEYGGLFDVRRFPPRGWQLNGRKEDKDDVDKHDQVKEGFHHLQLLQEPHLKCDYEWS